MATIPEEYADFDFGFSAVDDEEYKAKTTEVEKKIVEVEAKSESLSNLEKKIDSAINEINYKKEYLEEKYNEDMKKVEKLILPLLYNLSLFNSDSKSFCSFFSNSGFSSLHFKYSLYFLSNESTIFPSISIAFSL